jgi:hypothetical protein
MNIHEIIAEEKIDEAPAGFIKQGLRKLGAKAAGAVGAKGKAAELTGKAEVGDEANQLKTDFRGYLGKTGGNPKQVQGPQLAAFLKSKGYPNMHLKGVDGVMTKKQVDDAIMQAAVDAAKADGDPTKTGAAPAGTGTAANQGAGQPGGTAGSAPQVDANNDGKDDATGEPMAPADDAASPAAKKIEFTPNQEVVFVSKAGKETPAKVVGKSEDGDDSKVSVQGAKGQKFNIPRNKLLDPKTKKPFGTGTGANQDAGQPKGAAGAVEIPAEMQKKIDSLNPEQKKELASLL